ncbi:MAG: zinc-binding dehydrogenase [Myxococcales bacterium]|nr:zinc-binding dehydrogenase [Myxococcales bacterium]MCB9578589.1 zinc-binding dehydrogenase [Polyangiaceae bacterium]
MRAIWITRHGGPNVLEVKETPDPVPAAGEALVRVEAVGLNFAEVMARQGLYPDAPKPPCVVGYEGAGVIEKLGAGVSGVTEGQRVLYLTRFNGHQSKVAVSASQVFPIPDEMSFEEAAAIPVNYLTAYHMLFRIARVRKGEHVLVHMAAGGVGTAALQLCRTVEGLVTYGTASAGKHDYAREQGCDHPIDYRNLDYVTEIRRLTEGRGVDLVLDALGGADWKKGYSLLKPAGMLIAFGLANANSGSGKRNLFRVVGQMAQIPWYSPMKLMNDNRAVAGVNMGHLFSELDMLTEEMKDLVELYRQGKIRPHVGKVFPFSEAAAAHQELEQGKNVGKVVLTP